MNDVKGNTVDDLVGSVAVQQTITTYEDRILPGSIKLRYGPLVTLHDNSNESAGIIFGGESHPQIRFRVESLREAARFFNELAAQRERFGQA